LQVVAMGLVLTIVDVSFSGYDAVPDLVGWVLVVLGLRGLRLRVEPATLTTLAVLSGLVSVGLLRSDWVESLPESTGWLLSLPQFAFSFVLCTEVSRLVGEALARRFRGLRWAFLVAASGGVLLYGGGVDVLMVPFAVLTVAANVYLVYLLFRASGEVRGTEGGRPRD
jgi:hypothetical protein